MEHNKHFTEEEKESLQNIKGKYYDDSTELTIEEVHNKELDEVFFELSNQFISTIAFIDKIMSVISKELNDFDELKDEKASNSDFLNKDYFLFVPYRKYFTEENKTFFNLEKIKKIGFLKNELGQMGYGVELYTIGNSTKVKIIELESSKLERLSLSGLPNFNLRQRYELFRKLGFEDIITKLNTTKQMSKYKIIALIMGINPDNAKQLQNKTYSELKLKDTEEIKNFLDNQSIKL